MHEIGRDFRHRAHAAEPHRALELAREDLQRAARAGLAAGLDAEESGAQYR
jgi:hypothetical protein